jgi:hypothetical protein
MRVTESRAPRRVAVLVALGATFALSWLAPTSTAAAAESSPPAPQIQDITAPTVSANPLAGIPPDFAKVMGYRPTLGRLANGEQIAINPNGGCSVVGGGRPFDLSTVCKAHDLGYDLLRYAHRQGDPLDASARMEVDEKFSQDLRTQCSSRYVGAGVGACDVVAASFDAAVDFNSWRQGYGPPVSSSGMPRTVAVAAFSLLILYFLGRAMVTGMIGRRRPRRTPLRLAAEVAGNS